MTPRMSFSSYRQTIRVSSWANRRAIDASAGCSSSARSAWATSPTLNSPWSLDHLFVDEEGVPTLVEVKRGSDTRIRREVVGQTLDYAANASSYWGIDAIRNAYESTRREAGRDPEEDLATHVVPDWDAERFWQEVATNLRASRLRLVFVADVIPHELRRIVELLNEQMTRTDVLAIEVRQYVAPGTDMVTLMPRLIGQTEAARDTKRAASGRPRHRWSESELIETLRATNPGDLGQRMLRLYEFMRDRGARRSGRNGVGHDVARRARRRPVEPCGHRHLQRQRRHQF
jgi:hypothetical protein